VITLHKTIRFGPELSLLSCVRVAKRFVSTLRAIGGDRRNWIIEEGQAGLAWFIDQVEAWLDDPASEETAEQFSGVALAKKCFERLDYQTLDGIGVQIVQGDHPGSSYYAAVLRQDIDSVNQVARGLGLAFRFR